jgi:NAD(P)-dependent dehydrogenase (short-subunit alcohol dehydrogenase family)
MTGSTQRTTLVVGASRGLGRGVAAALAAAGDNVITVARSAPADEIADAADPTTPATLLDRYQPDALVLVAGARPHIRPLHEQTWETFSVNWYTDVKMTFHWLREALLTPLPAGGRVIVFGSGAALQGSPLSGGYAGAKATQRFLVRYAAEEADRAGLGIAVTELLPRLTPRTGLGQAAVRAYAARAGMSEPEYLAQFGEPLTPEIAGQAVVDLLGTDPAGLAATYLLTGGGAQPMT